MAPQVADIVRGNYAKGTLSGRSNDAAATVGHVMGGAMNHLTRRTFVGSVAGLGAAAALPAYAQGPAPGAILKKAIPSSGEQIPAVGLGTWITFNVGSNEKLRDARAQVMQTFFDRGGSLIDSSPMYGSSEAMIGHGLARIKNRASLFSASKVWTMFKPLGVNQMESSRNLWGIERFDLMQIHNLLDWSTHIETLKTMKAQGARALHRRHNLSGMAPRRPRKNHAE